MLLLKAFYQNHIVPHFTRGFSPGRTKTALLLSHDVDARESFVNSLEYARLERKYGVRSTFFITTKNFSDHTDTAYFTPAAQKAVKTLHEWGFHIGSHSVSHAKDFEFIPKGKRLDRADNYRPLKRKTVYGELQLSKKLLADLGIKVNSFRAGHLAYHPDLGGVLDSLNYSVNSTASANDIMCNFP